MVAKTGRLPLRLFMILCICLMLYAICTIGLWLLFGVMALDSGPTPQNYVMDLWAFAGFLVSTCMFWKWPWVAAVVAWSDLIANLIFLHSWSHTTQSIFFHWFFPITSFSLLQIVDSSPIAF